MEFWPPDKHSQEKLHLQWMSGTLLRRVRGLESMTRFARDFLNLMAILTTDCQNIFLMFQRIFSWSFITT
jgi:hypothetical protein